MNINYRPIGIIILIVLSNFVLSAQIVNTESSRMHTDTIGWMGSAGAAFIISKTVEKVLSVDLGMHLQYKTKKSLWLLLGSYNFLKAGNQKFLSNSFEHIRYNYKLSKLVRWEIFTQLQNNQITQIGSRFLLGTGPRFRLITKKRIHLYVATSVMYEKEKEITKPVVYDKDIRSNNYVVFTLTPKSGVMELISTTYYQPLFKNWEDYRVLNQISLKVKTSKRLSLSLNWNYLFDSRPAGTAPKENFSFATGVDLNF